MLVLGAAALAALAPAAGAVIIAGQITSGDKSQTGSLDVTGTGSTCVNPKGVPANVGGGTYAYDAYGFFNTDTVAHCYPISVASAGLVEVAAYLSAFNPGNIQTNYVGDPGFCTNLGAGSTVSFQVNVPAQSGFYVVVSDCVGGSSGTPSYTLTTTSNTLADSISGTDPSSTTTVHGMFATTCSSTPPTPSPVMSAPINYQAFTILNTSGALQCVTATIYNGSEFDGAFATAYLGSFDPGNPQTNYIGDIGDTIIGAGGTLSFSFRVPAGGQYVLVLRGSGPGQFPYYRVTLANNTPTAAVLRSASATRTSRGIVVRWRTAAEDHLLGFNLYRVQGRKSVRVNRALILGVFGGTTRGHSYSWLDPFAPRTGSLRYRLQEVRLDGTRSWLDSVTVGS